MKNLEPTIYRQRLVLEGHYTRHGVSGETIKEYLGELSKVLEMRIFSGPYSWPPDRWDNPEVPLFELNGFVAWTESGCHVYAWRNVRFFTADIYSCKQFDVATVTVFTKKFFCSEDVVFESY